MNSLTNEEIFERLSRVRDFLKSQSAFPGDSLSWAAECIATFLDGSSKSLDHAFELRSSKRGQKPMQSGTHDDWVVNAFFDVLKETPKGKNYPDTKTLAHIGRYYGLGGKDAASLPDHGIASELKRILKRYSSIINQQIANELIVKLNSKHSTE